MKKLSFKSPGNRKSKIEPKLEKINSDEKDPEYLQSEQIDSDSNTPANRQFRKASLNTDTDQSITLYEARFSSSHATSHPENANTFRHYNEDGSMIRPIIEEDEDEYLHSSVTNSSQREILRNAGSYSSNRQQSKPNQIMKLTGEDSFENEEIAIDTDRMNQQEEMDEDDYRTEETQGPEDNNNT